MAGLYSRGYCKSSYVLIYFSNFSVFLQASSIDLFFSDTTMGRSIFFIVIMKKALISLLLASSMLFVSCSSGTVATTQGDAWVKGNPDAKVTLTEFSDFQCPACGHAYPVVKQLLATYGDKIRFEYRHFPLTEIGHTYAEPAAIAAEAAGRQGKFWEMHDKLFENQEAWTNTNFETMMTSYAKDLGLDVDQFNKDRQDPALRAKVLGDKALGNSKNITGTPTFFLNGVKINFNTFDEFDLQIKQALEK